MLSRELVIAAVCTVSAVPLTLRRKDSLAVKDFMITSEATSPTTMPTKVSTRLIPRWSAEEFKRGKNRVRIK